MTRDLGRCRAQLSTGRQMAMSSSDRSGVPTSPSSVSRGGRSRLDWAGRLGQSAPEEALNEAVVSAYVRWPRCTRGGAREDGRVRTLGIDLATTNGSTGLCEVDWATGASLIEVGRFPDRDLVARMQAVREDGGWVAIDAPFGFPTTFTAAVRDWDGHGQITTPDARDLIRRITDIRVAERQQEAKIAAGAKWFCWPLSAVVERITPTAIRCAGLLSSLEEGPVDRVGLQSQVIEVYPIASLRLWGADTNHYKQDPDDSRKALRVLCARTGLAMPDGLSDVRPKVLDDVVDAFACALMARTAAMTNGRTGPDGFTTQELDVIDREGWIHLPPAGHRLAELAQQP